MQKQAGITLMPVRNNVVDPPCIETAGPGFNPMHCVAFVERQFGKVGTVWPVMPVIKAVFSINFRALESKSSTIKRDPLTRDY
jgi:hypothetical protein